MLVLEQEASTGSNVEVVILNLTAADLEGSQGMGDKMEGHTKGVLHLHLSKPSDCKSSSNQILKTSAPSLQKSAYR